MEEEFKPPLTWPQWIIRTLRAEPERLYSPEELRAWYAKREEEWRKKANKVVPINRQRQADNGSERLL